MTMNVHIQHLAERLRHNAEFRLAKQKEVPSDLRNTEAATESERLAAAIDTGEVNSGLARVYAAFCEDERTMHHTMDVERELVSGIGFHSSFDKPNALLSAIIEGAHRVYRDEVEFAELTPEDEASVRGEAE